jgi:hypothetical protein
MLTSIETLLKKTSDSNYVYYDCRGATVVPWMPAYKAVQNLLSMISMGQTRGTAPIALGSRYEVMIAFLNLLSLWGLLIK